MERRQNNGERCRIVQRFVLTIEDDNTRLACYMYMRNCSDKDVRKQLHIKQEKLDLLKLELALALRQAGIRI
jgi:hypothetical protein